MVATTIHTTSGEVMNDSLKCPQLYVFELSESQSPGQPRRNFPTNS